MEPIPGNWRWRDGARGPAPAVVFDLDGVLSDARGRQHFLDGPGRRDWDGFFSACGDDPVIASSARLLEVIDPGSLIVMLTGRPVRVRDKTVAWLDTHGLRWDLLIMRAGGSYSAARDFKRDAIGELRTREIDPVLALDDDVRIVEMFDAAGVPCVYVHSGYYD